VLYNADRSQGRERLLFMVNPTLRELNIPLDDDVMGESWRQLADVERFLGADSHGATHPVERGLFAPALSCGLWITRV